ncbi:MAG: pantoate--beta-alanine ligase [Zavarzinella sp.]
MEVLPEIIPSIALIREKIRSIHHEGKLIGLVPTMGALHDGHAELMRTARGQCDYLVTSIFVNPVQFGPNEDYDRYPRTFEADKELCRGCGVDAIFAPTVGEMYPDGFQTYIDVTEVSKGLCGDRRPHHFRGVTTVVGKLFHIVSPDIAWFGQKDAQQVRVIRQMVKDLLFPVNIVEVPTVREPDGLALSSRNRYLTESQRTQATCLVQALRHAEAKLKTGVRQVSQLRLEMIAIVDAMPDARLDYIEIVDEQTLQPMTEIDRPALVALAVYFDQTRLIDNTILVPN